MPFFVCMPFIVVTRKIHMGHSSYLTREYDPQIDINVTRHTTLKGVIMGCGPGYKEPMRRMGNPCRIWC